MMRDDDSLNLGSGEEPDQTPEKSDRRAASGVRRLTANIGALLTSTVFERAMRFALYAMVARSLGATDLGRLALAVAVFQLVSRLAVLGIPVLATREVAKNPGTVPTFVVNGGVIIVLTSIVGYAVLLVFVRGVGYEADTAQVIWLLFAGLLPFCFSRISEAVFIGLERAEYVAFVNVPVNLLQTLAAFLLLRSGYGMPAIALSLAIAYAVMAILQLAILITKVRPDWSRPNIGAAARMVKDAAPFLGIEGTVVLRSSSTAIFLSILLGETAVGIFSAAVQLQMPIRLVGNVVATGLFPVLVRAYRVSIATLKNAASRAVELVLAVILPAVAGLMVVGDDLLTFIYGGEFTESDTVLRLLAWAGLGMAMASILGRVLMAADRELLTLRIALVNTTAQIVIGVWLTIQFGVVGAAVAMLVVAVLNILQHYVPVSRLFAGFSIWPMVWRPIVASTAMVLFLIVTASVPVLLRVVLGAVVYAAALLAVSLWSAGGRDGLIDRWRLTREVGEPTV
jgi:O-antigen/teichoic acid export membrane protein